MTKPFDVIMALPDQHIPWCNWKAIEAFSKRVKAYKKQGKSVKVVNLGDVMDQKAWSRFSKDPDDLSPHQEWSDVELGMDYLAELLPEMTIVLGNHDSRAYKKAVEVGLPKQLIRSLEDLFPYEGWTWHMSTKPLMVDGIMFIHGDEMAGGALQKAAKLGRSVVQGHVHKGNLNYVDIFDKQIFAVESGCVIDREAIAFRYAAKHPLSCFIGWTEIHNGVPHLVPFK